MLGKQNSILNAIVSLVLYFSMRETTKNSSVLSVLSKDNCQERVEVPGRRGRLGKERCRGKTRKRDLLDSSLWCATIQGMKRNLTLD